MNLTTILEKARQNPARSLIFSLILIAAAAVLRIVTPITLSYVTFYPAVILATVAGGWIMGLLAMVASTGCVLFVTAPLVGSPEASAHTIWNVGAFWLVCLLIIWLTDLLIALLMNTKDKADKLEHLYGKLAAAETRQQTLMRELSHRMKNQYAVILAMARATANDSASLAEFQAAFSDRLHSMSRAHDLLTQKDWKSVALQDLIRSELEAFRHQGRLNVHGDALWLKEHAVVNIGLALHELATNSTKHGAWSGAEGKVTVSWEVADGHIQIRWQESGGPLVRPGERRGFGSRILERIVPSALQGNATMEFAPEGLCWTLLVPAACVHTSEDRI